MTLCSLSLVVLFAQAEVPLTPAAEPAPVEKPQLSSTRVLASIGAGLVATSVVMAGGVLLSSTALCAPGRECLAERYLLMIGTSFVSAAGVTLAVWLTHRALDGKSGIGWTILGAVTASVVGAVLGTVVGVAVTGRIEPVPMIIGGGLASAVAGGLMTEVGHLRSD